MRWIIVFVALFVATTVAGQTGSEICDNAMDDDGDGLIDLNDDDCACQLFEPVSLIPNPSFEDSECCPQGRSQLHCAETWIQASTATTDYLHTCGWLGWPHLPPPLPFPDGEACIGFRDGRFSENETNPNWKEYTGACLSEPLRAGNTYRLEFYIGFTNLENSPPINLAFFGSASCDNLPFGEDDQFHGCPTNGPGWTQLDVIFALGANSWVQRNFDITPTTDFYAIAIGPDCMERTSGPNPYYFLDDLVLADVREFEFVIQGDTNLCKDDFSLKLPMRDSLDYQWYLDGVALVGETGAELSTGIQDGKYQVLIEGQQLCRLTRPYVYRRPKFTNARSVPLCPNSQIDFFGDQVLAAGQYSHTLKSQQGCDSVVTIDVFDAFNVTSTETVRIFPGETLTIGNHKFSEPTREMVSLKSSSGCDSLVDLTLEYYEIFIPTGFTPNGDGINDQFFIEGSDDLVAVNQLTVFDRWGGVLYRSDRTTDSIPRWDGLINGEPVRSDTYLYVVDVLMNDGRERTLSGTIHVVK